MPATVAAGYTDFLEHLKAIPASSNLYDVYALDQPVEMGGTETKIAQIVTASQMTTSNWGDEHLYIRHQRMDADLAIKPEWEFYTPKYGGIFSLEQEESNSSGCPFANIIDYLQ